MDKALVCLLTTVHYPFDTRIFHRQARSLQQAGYRVVLIAPHHEDIEIDGIKVLPLPGVANRLARFACRGLQALARAFAVQADVYHFHDPELIPAALLLKLAGKKVIYDVHEDYPAEILGKPWLPRPVRKPVSRVVQLVEKGAARFFDAVIAATPPIAAGFGERSLKPVVIQNFPLSAEFASPGEKSSSTGGGKRVVYVGDITVVRGIREMVTAVGLLPGHLTVSLLLGGRFSPPGLVQEVKGLAGWERTEFLGWLDRGELASALGRAVAGLVLFHPLPNHVAAQPNKMYEYMAAGLPVIASDFPPWREVIERHRCGIVVDPLDPRAIAAAIERVLCDPTAARDMGSRGRAAVESEYSWAAEEKKLLELYAEVLR